MLPYASYLRVYEPLDALPDDVRSGVSELPGQRTGTTLQAEQQQALAMAVGPPGSVRDAPAVDAYALRRDGRDYFCPVDLSLRSWLSLTRLVDSVGDAAVGVILPEAGRTLAGEAFLRWRQENPTAVPHIRQTTWGVPRTWFVMVVEDERETYSAGSFRSVRYRSRLGDARRRMAAANRLLRAAIDDVELLDEMVGLADWLESFDAESWVELDYAGVARFLGDQLASDQSARDIHRALDALRREDFSAAGEAYRTFEERWRAVNAYERAN
ncbi:MAG TPA: hypothetical protein VLK34_09850 [Nocardioidaceae bacterium]|nr:hypothetical protein [Nocardioidaceae bacterium]